jgi:hypothetical protein
MMETLRGREMWCSCGKKIVIQKEGKTIVKNKLLILNEEVIEIKCKECGKMNILSHKN